MKSPDVIFIIRRLTLFCCVWILKRILLCSSQNSSEVNKVMYLWRFLDKLHSKQKELSVSLELVFLREQKEWTWDGVMKTEEDNQVLDLLCCWFSWFYSLLSLFASLWDLKNVGWIDRRLHWLWSVWITSPSKGENSALSDYSHVNSFSQTALS